MKYVVATAAEFRAYNEARGREITATDEQIDAALLVASEWIDFTFQAQFSGYKTGGFLQAREWPRTAAVTNTLPSYVFATNEIPAILIDAVYEAAFRQVTGIALYQDYTPGKYKSVSVDGAVSVEYASFSFASDMQTQMPIITQILAPLFGPTASVNFSVFSGAVTRV